MFLKKLHVKSSCLGLPDRNFIRLDMLHTTIASSSVQPVARTELGSA
jgi:hypothetical protein